VIGAQREAAAQLEARLRRAHAAFAHGERRIHCRQQVGAAGSEVERRDARRETRGDDGAAAAERVDARQRDQVRVQPRAAHERFEPQRADQRQPPGIGLAAGPLQHGSGFGGIRDRVAQVGEHGARRCRHGDELLPVAGHRIGGVGHQRRQRDGGDTGRRVEPDQSARDAERVAEAGEQLVGDVADGVAHRVHHRVGRGEVERRIAVAAELHAVGGEHEDELALRVEAEADAQRVGARDGRRRQVEHAVRRVAGSRPDAEARQCDGGAADEVDAEQLRRGLHARRRVAELDAERRRETRIAARAGVELQTEHDGGTAEREAHAIGARHGAEQAAEMGEPIGAALRVGEDAAHPMGQRNRPLRREFGDREVEHRIAALQSEQAAQGGDRRRRTGRIRLRLDEAEHELEHRVVELVGAVGGDAQVSRRRRAGQLQAGEREGEERLVRSALARRNVDLDADAAQPRLPRQRGRGIERDLGGEADAAGVGAQQQRLGHRRPAVLLDAKERNRERGVRHRRRRHRAHAHADAHVQAVGPALVDGEREDERRIVDCDQRQPDHAGFRRAVGAAERGIDERDQRAPLIGVRQHLLQR